MTLKQKKFADEYIISCNATEAYLKVYTSVKKENVARTNASRLLTNANVKNYIDERLSEIDSEKIADQKEVMEYLSSVMRGEQTEQTLKSCGAEWGQEITDIEVGAKDRIKAAELLGKRYGMWTDKIENSTEVVVIQDDI
ncbi:terminase small subunit [Peptostreptococcus anaerobius]|uniref:terminase small subunit n=1 Tax=Peptostreptococcus TaxID=1257 RepID=UPI001A9AEF07|nr:MULTISPECIES: terminase small subunit [Peptostreptococcus]MDB8821395.1 terminase small subunit [Peptostreptococcus anaerobius]MDB8825959.1 terminase small subunit [Peptostreptococcus anaerobius]MDB8827880.1 terminase small subunit [Peptostreptococcus anaerobius]MDB8829698.1 terminase small subunit [Peptostreptococcus anaerobius]MDB8831560.1 terminase small subunit [Peptostreptococcus anaerobius]